MNIERRDPAIVLLLGILTCGLYLIYWYMKMYEDVEAVTGETPTGNSFGLDLAFVIITCMIYGIWVDYRLSQQLYAAAVERQVPNATDTSMPVLILDIAQFVTGGIAGFVTPMLHQEQLNKIVQAGA